jgi:hypothetical protein
MVRTASLLMSMKGEIEEETVVFEEPGSLKERPDNYSVQIDRERHLVRDFAYHVKMTNWCSCVREPLISCNHSCNLNCKAWLEKSIVRFVSILSTQVGADYGI